jgi:hypothetical protein
MESTLINTEQKKINPTQDFDMRSIILDLVENLIITDEERLV